MNKHIVFYIALGVIVYKLYNNNLEKLTHEDAELASQIVYIFKLHNNPSYPSYLGVLNRNNNKSTNLVLIKTYDKFNKLGYNITIKDVLKEM